MKEKIEKLLQNEKLTAGKLAELLDVQPALISHLRAGRNKPSFDLVQKILRRFPQINPDWFLLDDEQMYRDGYSPSAEAAEFPKDLFDHNEPENQTSHSAEAPTAESAKSSTPRESNISETPAQWSEILKSRAGSKIERVIVFYSDGTFDDFDKR